MTDVALVILVLTPAILALLLRSNSAVGFLALCGGYVGYLNLSKSIQDIIHHLGFWSNIYNLGLILLIGPLLITLILVRDPHPRRLKLLINVLVALCAGGLLATAALPLLILTGNLTNQDSSLLNDFTKAQDYFVAIGLLVSLLLVWLSGFGRHKDKKHKK